eukprot:scaffold37624_cov62-Phaeocystis_antarctica.AAC.4
MKLSMDAAPRTLDDIRRDTACVRLSISRRNLNRKKRNAPPRDTLLTPWVAASSRGRARPPPPVSTHSTDLVTTLELVPGHTKLAAN